MCWASLGIGRGEAVFSLSGRVPALYSAVLGTLKRGAVFCPLFSAFGPEPIRARLQIGHGVCLVTTRALFQRKVEGMLADLPACGSCSWSTAGTRTSAAGEGPAAPDGRGVRPLRRPLRRRPRTRR